MPRHFPPIFGILAATFAMTIFPDSATNAQNDTWSVSAANWLQYWYHRPQPFDSTIFSDRQSRQDSLDNRFIVDFDLGDFYAGAWLRVLHPNRPDTSYQRIVQRYFGWTQNGLTIHAGNFYQTFDRGMTLNAFLDDAVYYDNNLDGVRVSGLYDRYDFDVVFGRAFRDRITTERENTVRAVRGAIKPILGTRAGFSYVRFKQDDFEDFSKAVGTNITSAIGNINRGPFEIYAEYATRRGRAQFGGNVEGDGTYLSGSFSHSIFSVYSEYKNIINLLYPTPAASLNAPPPVSHSGRSLTSLANVNGERAYQVGTLISPNYNLNFDLAFSESFERGGMNRRLYLAEKFAGARWSPVEKLVVNYRWDRFDYTMEDEIENYLEGYYYLNSYQTVSATAYTRRFILTNNEYHEDYLTLGFARGGFLQVSIGGSLSDNDIDRDPNKLGFIELTLRFKSHELVIFQGGERGGLVCSSGICSVRPTFEGTRVILFSRF
ncbi:MAG: hypothetical protein A2W25_02450 [candidate division Zixibacteria bacterium RBG_16_53_22]|nr:MAG: hypothetical protein A2W25_02450 [candidate division Zixibacteria bacterium RBG_16_53_22]